MPRFAANLSMLYGDVDFLDRFACAASDGFKAVECLFPYEWAPEVIAQRLGEHGLQQVLLNAPPGDMALGERGLACLPGRQAEFLQGLEQALHYARVLACPRIHVMAGLVPDGCSQQEAHACYVANLRQAGQRALSQGVSLMIEPINGRDMPGYFLNRQAQAHGLLAEIALPNVKVQMDLYHCQIDEGDLASRLRAYVECTGERGEVVNE